LHEKSSLGKPDSGNYYLSICAAINSTMYSLVYGKYPIAGYCSGGSKSPGFW